jgi:transcriptional regulator with XRE-family HTH domain
MYQDRVPGPGDLGRRIAARRQQLGLTQEQLAAETGISVPYLAYIEAYPASPTMSCLTRLARALQLSIDELCGAHPAATPRLSAAHGAPV